MCVGVEKLLSGRDVPACIVVGVLTTQVSRSGVPALTQDGSSFNPEVKLSRWASVMPYNASVLRIGQV